MKGSRFLENNLYVRGDGTRVYFFDKDELSEIICRGMIQDPQLQAFNNQTSHTEASLPKDPKKGNDSSQTTGFEEVKLVVDRRLLLNRARKLKMYRIWLQGEFRKPVDENDRSEWDPRLFLPPNLRSFVCLFVLVSRSISSGHHWKSDRLNAWGTNSVIFCRPAIANKLTSPAPSRTFKKGKKKQNPQLRFHHQDVEDLTLVSYIHSCFLELSLTYFRISGCWTWSRPSLCTSFINKWRSIDWSEQPYLIRQ